MSTTPQIRPMRPEDLTSVMEIERVAYSTPWPESSFRGLLTRTDTYLIVAEIEEPKGGGPQIVGYAASWAVLGQGELGNIAVKPQWQHKGVGRRLLESVVEAMREIRVTELFLEVRVTNLIAQRLYQSFGFRPIGIRQAYYSKPTEDAIVMRLDLDK